MNRSHLFCITGTFLVMLMLGVPVASAVMVTPVDGHPGAMGVRKAGAMSKASSSLARLFSQYRAHINKGSKAPFKPSNRFVQFANGRVLIDARASTNGDVLLNDLKRLGLQKGVRFGPVVSGLFPVAAIDRAVALDSLRAISASPLPILNTGSVTSQGDVAMRADIARSLYGVDGTGISVGVLSDSYNMQGGAGADVASGDLPTEGVNVIGEYGLCGILLNCIDEGRAMLQIIHDVAPGANLLFNTGLGGVASYANNITSLAAAGAEVIVDDLMYLNEPMFQDGIVAQAVDQVVAGGAAYLSAAGNSARLSYESSFDDSGEDFCIDYDANGYCDPLYELVGDMHDFNPGTDVDVYQSITIPVGTALSIALQWDEPFGNLNTGNGPKNDHIIVLLDSTGDYMLEISANDNVTTGEPWEVLQYVNYGFYGTEFNIVITFDDYDSPGPPATLMKAVYYGNGTTINEHETRSSTVVGHANSAGAEAVGAAFYLDTPEYGTNPPLLEPFSSAGRTPIIFDTSGNLLTPPEERLKPEIVAIDGVSTTFFYSDSHGDSNPDFFGTSAAAPHAAGVAALMLQAKAGATPAQINTALEDSAIDMGVVGPDNDTGHGLIQADAAIAALLTPGNTPPTADFTFSSINLTVDFTDQSSDPNGTIEAWNWSFGDGDTASTQNPSHSYSSSGTYTVTLTVTDDDGATGSARKPVTVAVPDTQAPTITAPADVSVEATGETTAVNLGSPTVTDDLDPNPTVSNNAPPAFPVGTTTVTWTATDASGNSASATQTVTVTDTTAPSISAPEDITMAFGDPVSLGTPTVSDLADPNPTVINNAPSAFPVGTTTVTWTATDASGNSASATQTVTVTEPASQIELTTSVYKVKGVRMVDLTWNGADGENVVIYRDRELLATTPNDGSYTDIVGKKPEPSYLYQVCEITHENCSSEAVVSVK